MSDAERIGVHFALERPSRGAESHGSHCLQNDKVGKVVVKYEAAIKEVDVKLSVSGGDSGKGPKQQKTEITIYTLRNGVVGPPLSHVRPSPSQPFT